MSEAGLTNARHEVIDLSGFFGYDRRSGFGVLLGDRFEFDNDDVTAFAGELVQFGGGIRVPSSRKDERVGQSRDLGDEREAEPARAVGSGDYEGYRSVS